MVEFRQLQYFVALSNDGSFARAAERQHITQSALSQQIARLEREFGVILFERSVRGARLTSAGTELVTHACSVLAEVGAMQARATSIAREVHEELRIGSPTYAVRSRARQRAVAAFVQTHPQVDVTFENAWSPQLLDLLKSGTVDLSFAMLAPPDPALEYLLMQDEPALLVVPSAHNLATACSVSLAELEGERIMLYPRTVNAWMFGEMSGPLEHAGAVVSELEESSLPAVLEQVRAGNGLFPAVPWEIDFINPVQLEGLSIVPSAGEDGLRYRMWLARRASGHTPTIASFWDEAQRVAL